GNEFCGMPVVTFNVAQGVFQFSPQQASNVNTTVLLRMGWSSFGLHMHVHVDQARVVPPLPSVPIWTGDAIEVFASSTSILTGTFGPGADEAVQAILAPPSSTQPALSETFVDYGTPLSTLPPSQFAARIVAGGYEIELALPWSTIAGQSITPPAADA